MSSAWGSMTATIDDEKHSKRFIRMWGYLTVAVGFLLFAASKLGISLL